MFSLIIFITLAISVQSQELVGPVVVKSSSDARACPSSEVLQHTRRNLSEAILQIININDNTCGGSSGWTVVANIDMSDPSQACPSPWTLYTTPVRSCSMTSAPGCQGVNFVVPRGTYTQVCGRAIGYGPGRADAFTVSSSAIDTLYLDGVSLTYGMPRQHIWSFASGHGDDVGVFRCPCDNPNRHEAFPPPSFVGDNYFCDGYYNGALWDAQDCTTACCTLNSPPYFTATLPAPTSENIEARICTNEVRSDEAVHVALLQLYVK